jgi:selenocysteine lyase/cysteine desulfurase
MARPVNIGAVQDRIFYLAGGYKYAMAGEGVCFLHSPNGYGARPTNTGWYAGFQQLETGVSHLIPYPGNGSRFAGSTSDPSGIYRLDAVLGWLENEGITASDVSSHVQTLQQRFIGGGSTPGVLIPPSPLARGNFLTYRTGNAADIYQALHDRGVITDFRGDRLRFGFGVYQNEDDVDRLLTILEELP